MIADEVLTEFGRTGKIFACEHEQVCADVYIFGKALRGGYLSLAITLLSHKVSAPFFDSNPGTAFHYGHSYTGNALGCAAFASLEVF